MEGGVDSDVLELDRPCGVEDGAVDEDVAVLADLFGACVLHETSLIGEKLARHDGCGS